MYSGQQGCWKLFAELFLGLRVPQMGPRLPDFRDSPDKAMAKVCLLQRTLFKSRLEGALGGRLRPCQWAHILQLSSTASGQDSGQTTKVLLMLVVSFCPCALRVWPVLSLLCRKRDAENVAAHLSQGISELSEFVICSWILGVCLCFFMFFYAGFPIFLLENSKLTRAQKFKTIYRDTVLCAMVWFRLSGLPPVADGAGGAVSWSHGLSDVFWYSAKC